MYTPFDQAREQLALPDFTGQLMVRSDDPEQFARLIAGTELTLAGRFGVDLTQDEMPGTSFPIGSALDFLQRVYDKACHTRPRELYATLSASEESVDARYAMPLAAMGKGNKAAVSEFRYAPTMSRKRNGESLLLGRSALKRSQIVPNPHLELPPETAGAKSAGEAPHRITSFDIINTGRRSGTLGAQRF